MKTFALSLFVLLAAGWARAEETKIKEADVPKAVLDGVAKKYPTAKRVGFEREVEHGKTVYEIQLVNDGHKIDVDVSPDGRIVEEEEEIAFDSAPDPVRKAFSASPKFGKWTVKRAEKVVKADKPDAPEYELLVSNGKSAAEIVFAADGKQLKVEEKKKGDVD
jgi:hypothetical protein